MIYRLFHTGRIAHKAIHGVDFVLFQLELRYLGNGWGWCRSAGAVMVTPAERIEYFLSSL
jgi:hypothetical protein